MNEYQAKLKELLVKSTITTGPYTPSEFVKNTDHIAVLINGKPVYLAGESDCDASINEAKQLASSEMYKLALSKIGLTGELSYGVISGSDIDWQSSHHAIVKSESGVFEDGQGVGELIGINLTENQSLGVLMCVNDSLARILDPQCPELDNGHNLSFLAQAN
ncbi:MULTISPECIES: hypothetical protein [Vibrio]|uniref:hypothetical protein n=1 Tax=Vibrio TaxID=662 RepID=UPI0020759011|nr:MULTISPECIES: hypothetical protein [Vibrio]USD35614.1 hypothetical protein J8Z27_22665 [Vibrio sp. SCSIO 43186]USD72738.1 hypothetical protein J4N41_22670 [Vibrio sp. SCSIO 43139]USD98943.1 hypothetical protein CTT30_22995 [Vibrio coralliilyticus]